MRSIRINARRADDTVIPSHGIEVVREGASRERQGFKTPAYPETCKPLKGLLNPFTGLQTYL